MKKLFLFLAMASTTMFVSCGSDDNGGSTTNPPVVEPTAITVTASAPTVQVGTPVTFTVKNNLTPAVDVTSSSTFTANGVAFNGPTFTPTVANVGTVTIVAKNGNLPTASIVITVTAPEPEANFIKYDGDVTAINAGDMIYWGAYYTDETQTDIIEVYAVAAHDGDLSVAVPQNRAYVDFTIPYEETSVPPAVGTYNWVAPFYGITEIALSLGGTPITVANYNSVSVNITELEFLGEGAIDVAFSTESSFGTSELSTDFAGSGFIYDASPEPTERTKKIEVYSQAKLDARKAQFFASKTKKLKK